MICFRYQILLLCLVICSGLLVSDTVAQAPADQPAQEQAVADRFLQVLLRRPRPGTALDRVCGFHVQNDSLDQLVETLSDAESEPETAGARQMILGLIQLQRGKPAVAADALAEAESLLPDDAACSYYLGRALLAVGRTEQAALAMERAIDRNPARNEALQMFTDLGRIYQRAGSREKALSVWTRLEARFPGDTRVGGQIARALEEEGEYDAALQRYLKLAETARDQEEKIAFAIRAAGVRRQLGNDEQALQDLEGILQRLRPGSWLYRDVRGRIEDGFLRSGDYDALADYYKSRLEKSSDDLALQTRLGRILINAGRLDEAKDVLAAALQRAPNDTDVRLTYVDLLISKGEIAAASQQFEQLVKQDPENPDYLLRWGQVLLDDSEQELDERRNAAAEIWQRLADVRSDDAVTLSQIADRMRSIEREESAIKLYTQAIEVDPQSPQYREYLGEYLHQLDRKDEAIKAWEAIAEAPRRNRESLVRLAEIFSTFDLPQRSLAVWKEAAELDLTFQEEVRYANELREASQHQETLARLDRAEQLAESFDEREQLLRERIATYQAAGTLQEQIESQEQKTKTADHLRTLALMHQAAGQLPSAADAIGKAMQEAPEDVDVLIVAVDIAERQNRLGDAVELASTLAETDTRFRTNHLQRKADLQMRLGQVDEALATGETLIEANPASSESYQFVARLAFRANRGDQGVTALRRAMAMAPRDNSPRRMLASHFADQYRTDEAIELHWQSLRIATENSDRIAIVQQLAPLYDRKSEIDELVRRLEEFSRQENDPRSLQLMVAAAYEQIQDYGMARQTIDQLLAEQPRDVTLLETMVRLSDAMGDVVEAAEYQQRITTLADTPENRMRLVELQLDAELIDIQTALSQRITLASDPSRIAGMIRSATARGDTDSAEIICREILQRHPDQWETKLSLAQLLLVNATTSDSDEKLDEAIRLSREIREMDVALDEPPATRSNPSNRSSASTSNSQSPRYWTSTNYEFARHHRIGRYANYNYGFSPGSQILTPHSFGHARMIAGCIELFVASRQTEEFNPAEAAKSYFDENWPIRNVDEFERPEQIWEYKTISSFVALFDSSNNSSGSLIDPEFDRELTWRLAELDPEAGGQLLGNMLMNRVQQAGGNQAFSNRPDSETETEAIEPLTEHQLGLLVKAHEAAQNSTTQGASASMMALAYSILLEHEFRRAGMPDRAQQYAALPKPDNLSYVELQARLAFHMQLNQFEEAEAIVPHLLPAIREGRLQPEDSATYGAFGGSPSFRSDSEQATEFLNEHRMTLIDATFASRAAAQSQAGRRNSTPGNGELSLHVRMPNNVYRSISVKAPLSTRLLDPSSINSLAAFTQGDNNANDQSISMPEELIDHLSEPLPDAPAEENKTRVVVAAFAHWWDDRPEECYRLLQQLCEKYPDDVDLQIERARLASELNQPRRALELLDSFDPLDSKMLVRKEMAAMNLAVQVGDRDRVKQAAERLFGLRMDTDTQLALADQLRRLGMEDKATAILQRLRGGRNRSESVELQIANAFLQSGEKEAAAEVAYSLLKRLTSGRSSNRNAASYQRRAVDVLKTAGRLDSLIAQASRRVEAAPNSLRARTQLAELYTAAGRTGDAAKVWEGMSDQPSADPQQMMLRAESLMKAKKYKESFDTYLDAFEKQPQLFNNNFYQMRSAATRAECYDHMFTRLSKFNLNAIPGYRIDEMIRMGPPNEPFSEAKRDFVRTVIRHPYVRNDFHRILRSIPDDELTEIPELREVMIAAICGPEAFSPTSTLWRVTSRSSNGTAIGPLEKLMEILLQDDEVASKFIKAAEEAREDSATRPNAAFLIGLYRVLKSPAGDSETTSDAIGLLEKHLSEPQVEREQQDQARISGGLLWQAGQMLENDEVKVFDDKNQFLIRLYSTVLNDPLANNSGGFPYSVDVRLINAFIRDGKKQTARTMLLERYHRTDHSTDNVHNPGYGDYQELNDFDGIADMLASNGFPFDALSIRNTVLTDHAKFERATRWGGSSRRQQWEKSQEAVEKLATGGKAVEYLNMLLDDVQHASDDATDETDIATKSNENESQPATSEKRKSDASTETTLAVDWLDVGVDSILTGDSTPTIVVALNKAFEDDFAKRWLPGFLKEKTDPDVPKGTPADLIERIESVAAQRPHDWTLPALKAGILASTEPEQVPAAIDAVLDRVPSVETLADQENLDDDPTSLIGLYSVASLLKSIDTKEHQESITRLADYIQAVGNATNEPNFVLATSQLTGDNTGSLKSYLAELETATQDRLIKASESDTCLRIAVTSAQAGDIEISTRALRLALAGGPPMKSLTQTGDAFALRQNNSSSVSSSTDGANDADLENRIAFLHSLIRLYEQHTGYSLLTDPLQPASQDDAAASDETDQDRPTNPDAIQAIYPALATIVIPDESDQPIYTYEKPLVAFDGYDNIRPDQQFTPESLANALANAAVAAGKSDELLAQLRERYETSTDPAAIATVMVRLAIANQDPKQLQQAIDQFIAAIEKTDLLPKTDPGLESNVVNLITTTVQQESYQKSRTLDRIIRTLLPLVESDSALKDDVTAAVGDLLIRTGYLIRSDSYTSNRHRAVADRLRQISLSNASQLGDREQIQKLIDEETELAVARYENYSGTNRGTALRQHLWSVVRRFIDDDLTAFLPKLTRNIGELNDETNQDYKFNSSHLAWLAIAVDELPADQQLSFWKQVVLGEDAAGPVYNVPCIVRYTPAPPLAAAASMDRESIERLPLLSDDVPLTDAVLILADLAAKQQESAPIADAIAKLSETAGDRAEEAELIIRLTAIANQSGSIDDPQHAKLKQRLDKTLEFIAERLKANVPQETDNENQFPTLDLYLVVKAIDAGWPIKKAEPLLASLRMYAIRGNQNLLVSVIERFRAHNGLGRTAGGTTEPPLDDYIVVSIPTRLDPDTPSLAPLYAQNDGWFSGTSGYNVSILMYKYPVVGDFEYSATITDGGWGEADVTYGGLLFGAQGFNQKAVISHPGRESKTVAVPSIEAQKDNTEGIKVSEQAVAAIVNGEKYAHDSATQSFPWVGISHTMFRTTRFKDVKLTGSPIIPREVNLIDPTMRGWARIYSSQPLPSANIPTSATKSDDEGSHATSQSGREGARREGWYVNDDDELVFHYGPTNRQYGSLGMITYLRPLLNDETISCSFWWEQGTTEFYPMLGRLELRFGEDELVPSWFSSLNDLADRSPLTTGPNPLTPIATDNLPVEGQWNLLTIKRSDDVLQLTLNDQPLLDVPVTSNPLIGVGRPQNRDVKIRQLKLTGDWPEKP